MRLDEFFRNKRVLVTGHTGFVGCWLVMVLQKFNAEVFAIALEAEENALYTQVRDKMNISETICDLSHVEEIEKFVLSINPEIVIHVAAYGFVRECRDNPIRTFSSNVMGTVSLFESIKKCTRVKSILTVSSDKVYRNDFETNHSFTEDEPLGGIDIYSCSKTCEDLIAQSYYDSFLKEKNIVVNIVRPGNILGGGDHIQTRLIPGMLLSFENKKPVEIRHPEAVRPWQYVLDAIDAYLTIICNTYERTVSVLGIYNVGPEHIGQMSVGEIATYMSKKIEGAEVHLAENNINVHEAGYLDVNIEKMKAEFQWTPQKNMKQILDLVFDFWTLSKEQSIETVCQKQIAEYYEERWGK